MSISSKHVEWLFKNPQQFPKLPYSRVDSSWFVCEELQIQCTGYRGWIDLSGRVLTNNAWAVEDERLRSSAKRFLVKEFGWYLENLQIWDGPNEGERRYMYPFGLVQECVTENPGHTSLEQKWHVLTTVTGTFGTGSEWVEIHSAWMDLYASPGVAFLVVAPGLHRLKSS